MRKKTLKKVYTKLDFKVLFRIFASLLTAKANDTMNATKRTPENNENELAWGSPSSTGTGIVEQTGYYRGFAVAWFYSPNGCGETFEPYTDYRDCDLDDLDDTL